MLTLITVVLLFFSSSASVSNSAPYTPTDYILLNCGASSNTTSDDGRNWDGDADYKHFSSSSKSSSFASKASYQEPSVTEVPYMTARIFHGKFTYKFPVSSGPKFLRLYFYPNEYPDLDITTSFFSVTANNYTLLDNFSAYLVAFSPPQAFIIKEFVITVSNNQMLNVTFTPSPNSFAFVNGIEVVSMPSNLYTGQTYGFLSLVDTKYFFELDNTTALETAYRLNVGGRDVLNIEDSGMFRTWYQDGDYIFGAAFGVTSHNQPNATIKYPQATPAYTAPEVVYKTSRTMGPTASINLNYNLSWLFTVDSGFYYLVRLHFCENDLQYVNQRVFNIFINNHTAEEAMDVIALSNGNGIPIYIDYVVWVSQSEKDLWVALHPQTSDKPEFYDAILNGLEIFKLNKPDGSLAVPNPQAEPVRTSPMLQQKHSKKKRKFLTQTKVIIGATLGSIVSLILIFSFIFCQRKHLLLKTESLNRGKVSPFLEGIRCKKFSLADILTATNNFDDTLIVGRGGFGNVYKGHIFQGTQYEVAVAIKRLNSKSHQGENEFWAEIEMLSQLRYINLVSLIGYCNENHEMILVYDYMVNGTLRDHLYNNDNIPLQWKQRLRICIGGARGLDYLHSGAVHRIIHRDVKTTNILLDETWLAKVSDFGLSKMGPVVMANVPITTMVKGTFGYMDPEYFRRLQLTEKSDVYSFGVVLFEVLCARPAVDISLEDDQIGLAGWALKCIENETIEQIIDPYLKGKIAPECLRVFAEIAKTCLHEVGVERPKMSDVVGMLEFALELQETAEAKQTAEVGDAIQSQTIDKVV